MGHLPASDNRLREVLDYAQAHGDEQAREHFGFKTAGMVERYRREAKRRGIHVAVTSSILKKLGEIYTPKELEAIAKGGRVLPGMQKAPIVSFEGERIRIGVLGDTHLGSAYTDPDFIYAAFEEFEKEGCEFVIQGGDLTEGMSNRPGHIYELTHLGYENQKAHAIEVMSQCPAPLYLIDGNHDRWYIKSAGAVIVKDVADAIGATFLGHDEGDISLKGRATLKVWHGEDGSSYALSYRTQKIIEAFTGGEKPNVLITNHVHKTGYVYDRHIHAWGAGCIQKQTKWMRGKRIAAHTGFSIVDIWVNKSGVAKFRPTWYPFYS